MRHLLEQLSYYKAIHPIRFWVWILAITFTIIIIYVSIKYLLKLRLEKKKTNPTIISESQEKKPNHHNSSEVKIEKNMPPEVLNFYARNRKNIKFASVFVFGIIIGIIGTQVFHNINVISENLSISNSPYLFGIDISHYQGKINWGELRTSHHPIEYIFIRSTMGMDGKDKRFKENWKKSNDYEFMRGAYHYYRPNENSTSQFDNFSSMVELTSGDFPPILDVERPSKFGSENLREGVLNWLRLAEEKYGVKPILYTGRDFYNRHLKNHVEEYPLWIASYSGKHKLKNIEWTFHQFTEKVRVKGIKSKVDGNDFRGELIDLKNMCLE